MQLRYVIIVPSHLNTLPNILDQKIKISTNIQCEKFNCHLHPEGVICVLSVVT